ncbi:MAG: ribosome recycling factor [Candidatus Cloacimonetes bacterium]|nr:ribosome recycling factor [Candidatus Cloacimonadota bacterium]
MRNEKFIVLTTILSDAEAKFDSTLEHLRSELASIRTGRASPLIIENIKVPAYETEMLLKELAAISAPEHNLLIVSPWDQNLVETIEKALRLSSFHFNPIIDGGIIKVFLPPLSEERRREFTKMVSEKSEEARIAVRNIRHDKIAASDELCDEGQISEDEHERFKKEIQKMVDGTNEKIQELREAKEKELMEI